MTILDKYWPQINSTVWGVVFLLFALMAYVNWAMPHGKMYDTGDVVCQNDGRGPCAEEYKEDLQNINIPEWAKFLRSSSGDGLFIALVLFGIYSSSKKKDGEENK